MNSLRVLVARLAIAISNWMHLTATSVGQWGWLILALKGSDEQLLETVRRYLPAAAILEQMPSKPTNTEWN